MHGWTRSLALVAGLPLVLAACGSGAPPAASDPAMPLLADCFSLAPGTAFDMSDGSHWQVITERFQGQAMPGIAKLRKDASRSAAYFQTLQASEVMYVGEHSYDRAGSLESLTAYAPGLRIPFGLAPGESVQVGFDTTATDMAPVPSTDPGGPVAGRESLRITYLGRERLDLGGRSFMQACKLRIGLDPAAGDEPGAVTAPAHMIWLAPGFGRIAREDLDADGNALPGSRVELASVIVAAPAGR